MSSIEYINSVVLTAAASSVTFDNIPDYYEDLIMNVMYTPQISGYGLKIRFGQTESSVDSGTNYSHTRLYGSGSAATSGRLSNDTGAWINWSGTATNVNSPVEVNIFSYSNTNIYKTFLSNATGTASSYGSESLVDLWRSTNAIGKIELTAYSGNINAGSTFTLWGVR